MDSMSSEKGKVLGGKLKENGSPRKRTTSRIKWFIKNRRRLTITWDPLITLMTLMLVYLISFTTTSDGKGIKSGCGPICINSTLSEIKSGAIVGIKPGWYGEILDDNSGEKYIYYKHKETETILEFKNLSGVWKVREKKDNNDESYITLKNCSGRCPQSCTTIHYRDKYGYFVSPPLNLKVECPAPPPDVGMIVGIVVSIIILIVLATGVLYYFKRDAIHEYFQGTPIVVTPSDDIQLQPLNANEPRIVVAVDAPLHHQENTDPPPSMMAWAKKIVRHEIVDLGLTLPDDFEVNVQVETEHLNLPFNHTKIEAVCENPPPPGFVYKYAWSHENHDNISDDGNEQTKQKLETVSNSALNDPQLPQLLHLKGLDEGCHRFQVTVTCSAKNVLVTSSKTESFIGVVNVDSATSVTRGNHKTKCYGTTADEGVTVWTNVSHKIVKIPDVLRNSVLYRVPLPLKQNESYFDIKPTKECDIYITHETDQKQNFENSLKVHRFTELKQSRQVLEINKGSNTIQPVIWHRRIIKNDLPVSIHWDGPEKVNDAEIAIFVKEDFVDFVERPNDKVSSADSAKFVAKYHSESKGFKFSWKTKYTETEESEHGIWVVDDKNESSEFEIPNLKKGYYEINVMVIDYKRDCESDATSKLRVCETSVTFNKAMLSKVMAEVGISLWEAKEGYTIKQPLNSDLQGSQLFRMPFVEDGKGCDDAVRASELLIEIGNNSDIYIGVGMQKNGCCGWKAVKKDLDESKSIELQGKGFEPIKGLINAQPARLTSLWHKRAEMGEDMCLTQLETTFAIFIKEVDRNPEPIENEHDNLLENNATIDPSC